MQNFICRILIFTAITGGLTAQTLGKETILIETTYGSIKVKLYEETPLHTANFLKLTREGAFDSLLFHRVIAGFMIQGGDPLSKNAKAGDSLGHGDLGYTIPAEFNTALIHKKGTLCAAREGDDINPLQASSASQFYLVQGRKRSLEDLKKYEDRINTNYYTNCAREFMRSDKGKNSKKEYNRLKTELKMDSAALVNAEIKNSIQAEYAKKPEYKFDAHQVEVYTRMGGTPHLDGTYTVFGEIIEGIEVLDKIASSKTDKRDRPLENIRMNVKLLL
jgi:cyclophilin family peptidyl-prolyl cis-trans isomerase